MKKALFLVLIALVAVSLYVAGCQPAPDYYEENTNGPVVVQRVESTEEVVRGPSILRCYQSGEMIVFAETYHGVEMKKIYHNGYGFMYWTWEDKNGLNYVNDKEGFVCHESTILP